MKNKNVKLFLGTLAVSMLFSTAALAGEMETEAETERDVLAVAETSEDDRPRTIITTDGEVDDMDSMIHMLLYANDIDIDGLVYSASVWHWNGDGEHTLGEIVPSTQGARFGFDQMTEFRPMTIGWIEDLLLGGYNEAWPNLVTQDPRYPTPGELVGTVAVGNYQFEGDTREETAGSNLIMDCILDEDPRTLYLQAWGGANTISRALMSITEQYKDSDVWDALVEKINKKVVIISCGDQDMTYEEYIAKEWPGILKLNCVMGYGYGTREALPEDISAMFGGEWFMKNIKFRHGSLQAAYHTFGDGLYIEGEGDFGQYGIIRDMNKPTHNRGPQERYSFISEGDSPCFMYLLPVGLRGLEDRNYGSWGGRPTLNGETVEEEFNGQSSNGASLYRWVEAYQEDWAARADWCVAETYEEANHAPEVTAENLDLEAAPGETVNLSISVSDPDGDDTSCEWTAYGEASVYSGSSEFAMASEDGTSASVVIPEDAQAGDYFNVVCAVKDNADAPMTRYAQFIITVK